MKKLLIVIALFSGIIATGQDTNKRKCDGVKVTLNDEKNGVEVKFNGKPSEDILSELKGMGFRWSKFQKIWYAKQSEKTISFANSLTNQTEE